jgi:hypothetical protein
MEPMFKLVVPGTPVSGIRRTVLGLLPSGLPSGVTYSSEARCVLAGRIELEQADMVSCAGGWS